MTFEEYLVSKKIDSNAFRKNEGQLWELWKEEFEQMHPNSFTIQKLNLINPIRRKYHLTIEIPPAKGNVSPAGDVAPVKPADVKPVSPKPVFKPKPKIG